MACEPTVGWNVTALRWMAWGAVPRRLRREVERVEKADAKRDLDELTLCAPSRIDRRRSDAEYNDETAGEAEPVADGSHRCRRQQLDPRACVQARMTPG